MIPHLPCSALTCRTPLPPSARKWLCCGGRESTPRIERDKGRSRLCIRVRSKRAVPLLAAQRLCPKIAETVLSLQSRRISPPGRAEIANALTGAPPALRRRQSSPAGVKSMSISPIAYSSPVNPPPAHWAAASCPRRSGAGSRGRGCRLQRRRAGYRA